MQVALEHLELLAVLVRQELLVPQGLRELQVQRKHQALQALMMLDRFLQGLFCRRGIFLEVVLE